MARPNRIDLDGGARYEEFVAGGAISPGHLLEMEADGDVIVHATASGKAPKLFAREDALQGRTIDDAYASGERVSCFYAKSGQRVLGILKQGEEVVKGDALVSGGDGTLIKVADASAGNTIAFAAEDLDNNPGDGPEFLRIRVA